MGKVRCADGRGKDEEARRRESEVEVVQFAAGSGSDRRIYKPREIQILLHYCTNDEKSNTSVQASGGPCGYLWSGSGPLIL